MKVAVHEAVWELRQPIPSPADGGRIFNVPVWRLGGANGKVVCKKAFAAVVGGTGWCHRQALTLTIAGKAPNDQKAYKAASRALQLTSKYSPKNGFAQSWWRQHLMWQDWFSSGSS